MTGSGAAESEWHNFLGGESSPGEHSPEPSASPGFSVNTPAGPDEACSRPQDEQRERRPMQGQAGRASTRSSMSDGSSTMRQSGCFRHRVRFSDEGKHPQTTEDGDEVGDVFSTELSLTTSLFMGSASRGVVIPRLDTSKVVPTIMLGNIAASRPSKPLVTSNSNPSPRTTPPPSSARSQQQPRTTPRSNSASSFGATNSSTAASARQAAATVIPRPILTSPLAVAPRSARSSAVKPPHTASPAASPNGSMSARRSSSGTRVASNLAAGSVAPTVSIAAAAAAPTPAAIPSSRGFNTTGSTSSSSNRLTPRGSTPPLGKSLAKSSSASPLTVSTAPARALSPSPQPMSKQSLPPVTVSRQTSGKRSSTVAGGGALVSAPSKLPWSSTIGVRPPSQASSNISQLSESSSFGRRNRPPTAALEFMFTTSGQPSSGPTTPAKVGSVASRAQAAAAAAAAAQSSPATPVSRLPQAQLHDNTFSQPSEDGEVEQSTPRGALAPQNASDAHMGASQCADISSVTLDVQQGENSDVWASDNRSEEQALRSPQKAAHNKLSAVLSSPAKTAAAATPQQRTTPTTSSSTAQTSRAATAGSTAVIAGTAAAWSPEKVKPSSAAPARFVPASLQLHDEDLAQRVAAAAVSKAQLLDLVKMAVESVEGARAKAAEEESAAAAAAEAKNKGAVRGGIAKGGMMMVGDGDMGNEGEVPVKSRWCGCSIM